MLMLEVYNLLMKKHLDAFDQDGDFDYAQFENSSGKQPGELIFVLLLCHYEEKEEYEKCSYITNLRNEFVTKYGKRELKELLYED